MKRLLVLILVLTFLVVTGTLVSADGMTRLNRSNNAIGNQLNVRTIPGKRLNNTEAY